MHASDVTPGDVLVVERKQLLCLSAVRCGATVHFTCVPFPFSRLNDVFVVRALSDFHIQVDGHRQLSSSTFDA